MKHMTIAALALALGLAGCGFYHWKKAGADDAAFQKDSAECQQQQPASEQWKACMAQRGWSYSSGW